MLIDLSENRCEPCDRGSRYQAHCDRRCAMPLGCCRVMLSCVVVVRHCWGGTNSTGRRSGEASHSRVVLVIVADDHNVAADMLWLTGVDAGTCNDVFLPQCRCTEHTGHGELIGGGAGKEIACPTHPNACSAECMCPAERPELPCSLQVVFRPLPDQLCTSLRMGSWTPPGHNIINKAWILGLVDHLNG